MAHSNESLRTNYYHQTLELHLRCGADVLRKLVEKKINDTGTTLKIHLNLPLVHRRFTGLRPRILRPDQFQLLYPEPKLQEMDITLLSCLVINGHFNLSADQIDKVERLRKERNDLSHIAKPELEDDTKFKVGENLISEIARGVGESCREIMHATMTEIRKKELVTCHSNHEVVLLRGEIYMTKLIERPSPDALVDATNTTYLRFSLTKWKNRFTRSINIDGFLQKLKKESVVTAVEMQRIQTHYSKGEQCNDLVLKLIDMPDFQVLKFFNCLRQFNSDLADLLENKGDEGESVENHLKDLERKSIKTVLRSLFRENASREVLFEELQVAVEEEIGHDVDFCFLEVLVVQEFDLNQPQNHEYRFKGIDWTEEGIKALQRCSIAENDKEYSEEASSVARSLLDMRYEEFANFMGETINGIKDRYGEMIREALIIECISPIVFAGLSKEEIEEAFNEYLPEKRLIIGVRKKIQEVQEQLQTEIMKQKEAKSERVSDIRPFDSLPGQMIYQIGKVTFATGNLLVAVHECKTLPMTSNSTTTYIVKETMRFLAACLNSRRNGTIHFGIEDRGRSSGFVKGLNFLQGNWVQQELAARLNSYVSRGIDICFKATDIHVVKSCMRPFQVVQTVMRHSFVLEMDVVPSASCTNSSFFTIRFPPKGRQQDMFFVYNEETPCEIVSVSEENVPHTIHMYQRYVKIRAELEQETKDSHFCRSTIEKLKLRLTAGCDYCTEQYIPVLCCGNLTGVADETLIRNLLETHASDAFLSSDVVFDFDKSTKLRKAVEKDIPLQFLVKTTESPFDLGYEETNGYWVYCNGNTDLHIASFSENEWYKKRFENLKDTLKAFRNHIPPQRALVICLVFDRLGPRDPMNEFMKDCINLHFRNECVVITDSEENIVLLKRDICERMMPDENTQDIFFSGITWKDIAYLLRSVFQSPEISDIRLPCSSGQEAFLSKQDQADMKLTDIEVLSGKLCQEEKQMDDETRRKQQIQEKEKFYRGEEVSWWNFHYNNHVGERDLFQRSLKLIRSKLKDEDTKLIETQDIFHQPGAGGTTTGKYLLWHLSQFKYNDIRDSYRCCVVKTITETTATQISDFLSFEDENAKPVVALIDNATDDAIEMLKIDLYAMAYQKLSAERNLFCLLICIKRVPIKEHYKASELVLRHELSPKEKTWFETKYKELENSDEIDVETLISFNVLRKGFEDRFIKHLTGKFLKDVNDTETRVLTCLSLINTFDSDDAVPISIFDCLGTSDLSEYVNKGPIGLVAQRTKSIGKTSKRIWNTHMSKSMSLLIKRTHGSTDRKSDDAILQHNGIMIISQALARAVLDIVMATENISLSNVIEYVLRIVKKHVKELNPMSKEFVRIVKRLFITRQRSERGDPKEKFSDMIMELEKGSVDSDTDGCDTVIHLMSMCFEITEDAMVGQQLSRFYIDMKKFDKAEEIIKESIDIQPKSSYLLDTYGQIFYSSMVHQLSQWPQESGSIPDDQASEIIKTAFDAIEQFLKGQRVTIEKEGGGNNSCFSMVLKTSLELLENCCRFSFHQNEKDFVSFLNDNSTDIEKTKYAAIGRRCPINELRLDGKIKVQIEESLRLLEEKQYQLKYNLYTIHTRKGEQLLLNLRERYERFYGNEHNRNDYKFKYGIGLKSIMTVHAEDERTLRQRFQNAVTNIQRMERRMQRVDRRDLLVFLGYEIVKMSLKGAQEETSEPIDSSYYDKLLRCSERLLELEKNSHRPYLEAYLYFTILNWPSASRHVNYNMCKPIQLINALKDWHDAFDGNHRQGSQATSRVFPKTYFALGNRGLGCDIVDFSILEDIWRNIRKKKRKSVKDDQMLKESFVIDILERLYGTVNQYGNVVHYQVKRQHWQYPIEIKTYKTAKKLCNRQVTFILVFTWAGPRAYDVLEYEDDPNVALKSGQKTNQTSDTFRGAEAAPKKDNQDNNLADRQDQLQRKGKKKRKKNKK